jgi:hypothetical protein
MRVYFERTGGFAGLRLSTTLDSQSLDEVEVSMLVREIEQADFFSLPAQIFTETGGVDRFSYHILVEWEDQHHAVDVGEASLPETLRPLVEHLEHLLRSRR